MVKDKYLGIVYIIFSAFCFSVMNMCVQLAGDVPFIQKTFFRNFVAVICAVFVMVKQGISWKPQHNGNIPFLIIRSLCGTIGIFGNFYALGHLLLADASMLNKMSPFFAVVFSFIFLKEKMTIFQIAAVVVSFVGSLFIIKPTFENVALFPALAGLIGGMGAGAAYTTVRVLGKRGEKGPYIVFFFSAFSCLVVLPYLLFNFSPMTLFQFFVLIGAGIAAAGGQFSITAAYCYAPAREISIFDYTQIIFASILGFVLFGQIPDIWSAIGYVVICSAAVAMFFYNSKR
ncbi:MAG: DMT family transporter [Spirochaetales bacterium]|nr:DMT family transporter [Spirochaetales bacterium]